MKNYKPQLLPNNKRGQYVDWNKRIKNPEDWLMSDKLDGGWVGIFLKTGEAKSRSLKPINSIHVQRMAFEFAGELSKRVGISSVGIINAEFYSPLMTFGEIMHFMNTEDVTSDSKRKELQREWDKTDGGTSFYTKKQKGKMVEQHWEFPGRDVNWLCTIHDDLKFYVFDMCPTEHYITMAKQTRDLTLKIVLNYEGNFHYFIKQNSFIDLHKVIEQYHLNIKNKIEGIVLIRKDSVYKFGRFTRMQAQAFKMKNDDIDFYGVIHDVEEGDKVKEGILTTINELGKSRTSKLKEDREPNGMAKGFLVCMEDGRILTVSLSGYNHVEKRDLLEDKYNYIGRHIKFCGMEPTKEGGMPRSAFFIKGETLR